MFSYVICTLPSRVIKNNIIQGRDIIVRISTAVCERITEIIRFRNFEMPGQRSKSSKNNNQQNYDFEYSKYIDKSNPSFGEDGVEKTCEGEGCKGDSTCLPWCWVCIHS